MRWKFERKKVSKLSRAGGGLSAWKLRPAFAAKLLSSIDSQAE